MRKIQPKQNKIQPKRQEKLKYTTVKTIALDEQALKYFTRRLKTKAQKCMNR